MDREVLKGRGKDKGMVKWKGDPPVRSSVAGS